MVTVNAGWYTFSEANRCQYSIQSCTQNGNKTEVMFLFGLECVSLAYDVSIEAEIILPCKSVNI
jgi:hypothetical protein